jgi:serine-type D-Ala-D-Ala carboxypeptidase/endopeptidase
VRSLGEGEQVTGTDRRGILAALLLLLCGSRSVLALELPAEHRQWLESAVAQRSFPVVAVGLIDGGETASWYFGQRDSGDKNTANDEDRFEIGSATKVFTSLLLADAAREGKLKLDDTLAKFLPADFKFADPRIGAITLEELSTHRSGLPRLPANLLPANADDPYADYGEVELLSFLANYRPAQWEKRYAYSNLGSGLLGYVLGKVHGSGYARALSDKILGPAGLSHTGFDDSGLVSGHADDAVATHWHFAALAGAGGLRSTLPDMLTFAKINLKPENLPLRAALLLARQSRGSIPGGEVGLGWHIIEVPSGDQSWPLVWHNGGTGGFSTFIGFRTDRQRAVVLLANANADLTALGLALLGEQSPPPLPRRVLPIAAAQSADYTGLYRILPGVELTVRARAGHLQAQLAGQPGQTLYSYADDEFFFKEIPAEISFLRDGSKVNSLVLHQNGDHLSARRLSERAPRLERPSLSLTPSALSEYAGDYRFDADTIARVGSVGKSLRLQLTARAAYLLGAYARDRFAAEDEGVELVFHRGENGKPESLTLTLAGVERQAQRVRASAP